jgi:hypothetical protein
LNSDGDGFEVHRSISLVSLHSIRELSELKLIVVSIIFGILGKIILCMLLSFFSYIEEYFNIDLFVKRMNNKNDFQEKEIVC